MEEWKGGRSPTARPLIVIPSEQKNKAIDFYGHTDIETLYRLESADLSIQQERFRPRTNHKFIVETCLNRNPESARLRVVSNT